MFVVRHHSESTYGVSFAKVSEGGPYDEEGRAVFAVASKDGTISLWNVFSSTFKRP